jgi:tetratricopeptide (TPR) repeat protein
MRADRSLTLQEQWVDRHNPFDVTVLVRRMGEFWLWNPESGLFEMGCVYAVDPPTFRIHAVEDGDLAFACGDYESALAHYNAVFASDDLQGWSSAYNECPDCIGDPDFPPDPVESVNLHVYAGYRKVLAYTALGQIDQAEATLDEMEQRRSGIQYVDMARTFLEAYQQSNSLAVGCSAARALTQNFVQELFVAPDIYSFTFGRGYFSQFLDDPDSICPFEE